MSIKSQFGWYEFTRSFLDLTELACKELKSKKHSENIGGIKIEYGNSMNVAIVYNMKHAIEIFTKTLIRYAENDSFQDIKKHDLDALFDLLIEKFQNLSKKPKYSLKKAHLAVQSDIKNFGKIAEELKQIIDYYNGLNFLKKDDICIVDTNNTAFKYPENFLDIHVKIDYYNFFNSELDPDKIMKDVSKLKFHLNSMIVIFDFFHLGY